MARSPERRAYTDARYRCRNRRYKYWKRYGGRGIKFLFSSFAEFYAEVGPRPPGMVLDRKDNNSHYMVGNLHWCTPSESRRNQRPLFRTAKQVQKSWLLAKEQAKRMLRDDLGRWAGICPSHATEIVPDSGLHGGK